MPSFLVSPKSATVEEAEAFAVSKGLLVTKRLPVVGALVVQSWSTEYLRTALGPEYDVEPN